MHAIYELLIYLHSIIKHVGCPIRQRLRLRDETSDLISVLQLHILFLLIKCIYFMYRSLNLVKNIPTTCAATRYITIKIDQILKFSDIFICFLFPYFSSSIEKTPPFIFLFFCFITSSFLYGSQ